MARISAFRCEALALGPVRKKRAVRAGTGAYLLPPITGCNRVINTLFAHLIDRVAKAHCAASYAVWRVAMQDSIQAITSDSTHAEARGPIFTGRGNVGSL